MLECWNTGGTEAYVSALVQYLKQHNSIEFGVCLLGPHKLDAETKLSPWCSEIFLLEQSSGLFCPQLYRVIRSFRPEIVHNHLYTSLLAATLVARIAGVPRVVTTLHMPLYPWHWRHRFAWRAAIRASHVVVGVSNDVLASIGAREDRSRYWVVPCPLAADLLAAEIGDFSTGYDHLWTICGVGRLSREKDWPTLIKAFAVFRSRLGVNCRLVIYGEGTERPALDELIQQLSIGQAVDLPGAVDRRDLPGRLAETGLFVLPSRFEGFGIAAIEAMALGVPSITSDYGASLDYIEDGVTGHRFPCGNVQALADLLAWHYWNRTASLSMGVQGQVFVRENFSEENTLANYPLIYELPSSQANHDASL